MPLICAKIFYLCLKGLLIKLDIKYNKQSPPFPPPPKKKTKKPNAKQSLKKPRFQQSQGCYCHWITTSMPFLPRILQSQEVLGESETFIEGNSFWWKPLCMENVGELFCWRRGGTSAFLSLCAMWHRLAVLLIPTKTVYFWRTTQQLGLQGSQNPHGAVRTETKIPASFHWLCDEQTLGQFWPFCPLEKNLYNLCTRIFRIRG